MHELAQGAHLRPRRNPSRLHAIDAGQRSHRPAGGGPLARSRQTLPSPDDHHQRSLGRGSDVPECFASSVESRELTTLRLRASAGFFPQPVHARGRCHETLSRRALQFMTQNRPQRRGDAEPFGHVSADQREFMPINETQMDVGKYPESRRLRHPGPNLWPAHVPAAEPDSQILGCGLVALPPDAKKPGRHEASRGETAIDHPSNLPMRRHVNRPNAPHAASGPPKMPPSLTPPTSPMSRARERGRWERHHTSASPHPYPP